MGMSTENNFQLSIRAEAKGFNLRVRLKGIFLTSPMLQARHLSGSLSARARGLAVHIKLGLLQALGPTAPTRNSNSVNVVRYSLRRTVRKVWMKLKGNYTQGDQRDLAPKTKPSLEKTPSLKKAIAYHKKAFIYRLFPRKDTETKTPLGPARGFGGHLTPYIDDYTRMEKVVMMLQGISVVFTLIVLAQLLNTGGLPLFVTVVTGLAVSGQFVLKNYGTCLGPRVQQLWQDAIGIGGLSVLPQVIFGSYLPQYGPTEITIGGFIMIIFLLARFGKLPEKFVQLFGLISPWTTVSLFLWAPVTQLWSVFGAQTTFSCVELFAGLLAILSNCVQIPLLKSTKA